MKEVTISNTYYRLNLNGKEEDMMEKMRTFDENHQYIGDATRDVVHREGLWHETFHCWFMDDQYIYVQKRSATKADFPALFDITVAGHLEADETVEDGVREIREEVGIDLPFHALSKLMLIRDVICMPNFYDYELAHVYVYHTTIQPADLTLQKEEVEGVYRLEKEAFIQLCLRERAGIVCETLTGEVVGKIDLTDFVPHETAYLESLARHLSI